MALTMVSSRGRRAGGALWGRRYVKKNLWQRGDRDSGAQPLEMRPSLALPLGIDVNVAREPESSHGDQARPHHPRDSTQPGNTGLGPAVTAANFGPNWDQRSLSPPFLIFQPTLSSV